MKTWTNPTVEELEVKLTAAGFSNEGNEWDFWNPADGDPNYWNPETPETPENPETPETEYTPS